MAVLNADRGEDRIHSEDDDSLAEELMKTEAMRTAIAKNEIHATADQRARLDKAAAQMQHEYLAKSSQGYARAQEARERERGQQHIPSVI